MKPLYLVPLLLLGVPWVLPAQVDEELVDEWFARAERHLEAGRDRRAMTSLDRVLEALPDDAESLALALPALWNLGELERAETLGKHLLSLEPDRREARFVLAEVLVARGRAAEAEALIAPLAAARRSDPKAPSIDFRAKAFLARLHEERGQDEAARALHDELVKEARRIIIREVEDLVALAAAYEAFGGFREAEEVLVEAQKKASDDDPRPSVALGDLYLRRFYLQGDAVEEYRRALEIHPWRSRVWWQLYVAYREWRRDDKRPGEARGNALAVNPKLVAALVEDAGKALGDASFERADALLKEALEIRPDHRDVLALTACSAWMQKGPEAGAKALEAMLAVDGTYGQGLVVIAEVLNQRRRWPESLELCRRAVAIDPDNVEAWDARARYAFFLGLDQEGHEALRRADRGDRFSHPWRKNMFEVRRVLGAYYTEHATERFLHRFHQREAGVLIPYVDPFAQRSFQILSERYAFDPEGLDREDHEGKILVEWFRATGDFAARTIGFSNFGALGVCFGPFIGMNSPSSRNPGEFSWARTFHHELAHTMTVGLSRGRTPRWLTEGLSTYEEMAMDPSWDRGLYRDLHDALENGDLFKIRSFDAGFGTPRVIFAYFQAGLASRLLVETYGIEKVRALLEAYGRDLLTPEAFRAALGISPEDFDREFEAHVRELLKDVKLLPRPSARTVAELEQRRSAGETLSVDDLLRLCDGYIARRAWLDASELLGQIERAGGKGPHLESLHGWLALGQGDAAAAHARFLAVLESGFEDFDLRAELARAAESAGRLDEAATHWQKALEAFPLANRAEDPRLGLARIARTRNDVAAEKRHLEDHLRHAFESIEPRKRLIELYRMAGAQDDERRHLEAMLLLVPQDRNLHPRLAELAREAKDAAVAVRESRVHLALLEALQGDDVPDATQWADAHVSLASSLLLSPGQEPEARAAVTKALEAAPDHPEARALAERLGMGKGSESGGNR